jgi:hypothetical protein
MPQGTINKMQKGAASKTPACVNCRIFQVGIGEQEYEGNNVKKVVVIGGSTFLRRWYTQSEKVLHQVVIFSKGRQKVGHQGVLQAQKTHYNHITHPITTSSALMAIYSSRQVHVCLLRICHQQRSKIWISILLPHPRHILSRLAANDNFQWSPLTDSHHLLMSWSLPQFTFSQVKLKTSPADVMIPP